jgi:hypothetical protein
VLFSEVLNRVALTDDDFNIENFKPGTSGESKLYKQLMAESGLDA